MIHIRQFAWPDYADVTKVWKSAGRDVLPRAELAAKLVRDPHLFLLAEHDDIVAGVVLGTFDGRRGWILRLAVDPAHRRRGIARRLIGELENRFAALGCPRANLLVMPDNVDALQFWQTLGYLPLPDVLCSKPISTPTTP
ncbi:Acetyltransferase (GNAT) family protein [Micromonospora saelicesensis]|uniref:Acetyltransferase (GNAT) family protein n=1 Tax=Micromonospora saelicesensis TaxID=285676 RepID=A0A1C4VUP5_9ACTN|nr:Ribosomal-protein-alanine N-acetyltransferase [Micromonospora saelicesensis]SCE87702.1 Acetyltransferase (GNAT) family protein [Micromonospora saelicesensis]